MKHFILILTLLFPFYISYAGNGSKEAPLSVAEYIKDIDVHNSKMECDLWIEGYLAPYEYYTTVIGIGAGTKKYNYVLLMDTPGNSYSSRGISPSNTNSIIFYEEGWFSTHREVYNAYIENKSIKLLVHVYRNWSNSRVHTIDVDSYIIFDPTNVGSVLPKREVVTYFNLSGISSSVPHNGWNILLYNDGKYEKRFIR